MNVGIVGTRVANYGSLATSLRGLSVSATVTEDADALKDFDALLVPGVGHFAHVIEDFVNRGMDDSIREFVSTGRYVFGICLGMQLLFNSSSETAGVESESVEGLRIVPGRVESLSSSGCSERLPHIGWNNHSFIDSRSKLMRGVDVEADFYFVHSFHAIAARSEVVMARSNHGIDFVSVVESENAFGTQFHPEKSSGPGSQVLKNFLDVARC